MLVVDLFFCLSCCKKKISHQKIVFLGSNNCFTCSTKKKFLKFVTFFRKRKFTEASFSFSFQLLTTKQLSWIKLNDFNDFFEVKNFPISKSRWQQPQKQQVLDRSHHSCASLVWLNLGSNFRTRQYLFLRCCLLSPMKPFVVA